MKTLRQILSEVTKRTTVAKSGRSELQRLMKLARKNPDDKKIKRQVKDALEAEKLRVKEPKPKPEVKSIKEPKSELQMNSDIKRAMMSRIENRFQSDASSHFEKDGSDILQNTDTKGKTANQITKAVADASYEHFHNSKKDTKPSISLAPIKSLK